MLSPLMSLSDKWIDTPFLDCPRVAAHFTRADTKCGHKELLFIFKRQIASNVVLDTMHACLVSLTKSKMSKIKCCLLPPPTFCRNRAAQARQSIGEAKQP